MCCRTSPAKVGTHSGTHPSSPLDHATWILVHLMQGGHDYCSMTRSTTLHNKALKRMVAGPSFLENLKNSRKSSEFIEQSDPSPVGSLRSAEKLAQSVRRPPPPPPICRETPPICGEVPTICAEGPQSAGRFVATAGRLNPSAGRLPPICREAPLHLQEGSPPSAGRLSIISSYNLQGGLDPSAGRLSAYLREASVRLWGGSPHPQGGITRLCGGLSQLLGGFPHL